MGVVYLAEQVEPVRRRVALKIIKLGMDSKQVIARFESERQALAVMDHPSIARIYGGGVTERGRPYFAMELVQGTPITAYADTHRLDVEQRIRLVIDVCHAVQHAHHKGVIHRDLKPSNVLVTIRENQPIVKVIDFGIAKAMGQELTERTLVTRLGQMIGTPEYMSPEQAEMSGLDVDTRTDIYAIGIMLYELLVGALPFDFTAEAGNTVPHALRERPTPKPSTRYTTLGPAREVVAQMRDTTPGGLSRELKGDLDWIVLRAVDKDRTRRYETANGFALDLERHLSGHPVLARPPSAGYRLGKFIRRHRAGAAAAAVAVVAVLAGGAAATVGFVRARAAQAEAETEAATTKQVSDFLVNLFAVNDPGEARGNTITAREILDRGADSVKSALAGQPAVQARLMRTIGEVYSELGLYAQAEPLLRAAVDRDRETGDDRELARSLEVLGTLYRLQARYPDADSALQRAVAIERTVDPPDAEVARTIGSLGAVYMEQGRYDAAKPLLQETADLYRRLKGSDSPELATAVGNLGALEWYRQDIAAAERYFGEAYEIHQRTTSPNELPIARDLNNLGAVYYAEKRYGDAARAYQRASQIFGEVLGPDHPNVASLVNNIGEVFAAEGKYDTAETYFKRALAMKEKTVSPTHPSLAETLFGLANVYRDEGRDAEAEPLYLRSISLIERARGRDDPGLAEKLDSYGKLLESSGRADSAAAVRGRAAAIRAQEQK